MFDVWCTFSDILLLKYICRQFCIDVFLYAFRLSDFQDTWKSILRRDISTNSVGKNFFHLKDFWRHRQACSIISLFSIAKLRLTIRHESRSMNVLYIYFYEWKTSLNKLVWKKFMQRMRVLIKNEYLERSDAFEAQKMQQVQQTQQSQQEQQVKQLSK